MVTGQCGCALPVKYRPLLRVSRRKACPFLEVQLPRFQRGGAAESDPQQTSRHALRNGLADNQSQYFARLRGLSLIHAHGVVDAERAGAIGRNVKKASRRHHVLKDLGDIAGIS